MKNRMKFALSAMLLLSMPLCMIAQQPRFTKVGEFNIHNLRSIEERVVLLHAIQANEVFSYVYNDTEDRFDIFVPADYTCDDSGESPDFDAFIESCYDQWIAFSNLDKNERGSLFVQWRYQLEDRVFSAINEEFHHQWRNRDDNASCDGAFPFCTDNGLYNFPAGVDAGNLGSSQTPYYCSNFTRPNGTSSNCLYTTPNPAFYFMKISEPGSLNIYMHSEPSVDIDFDCWGPFSDINTACDQLSCSNMVDCSYSASSTENCYINNAQPNQYYILLITNYSNQQCNILFENIGGGATDCSILPPLVDGGGPYCVGETINLTANGQTGASYSWTGPGGFSSNQQNPSRPNCTMAMAGTYTCTITVGSQTNSATTEAVVVYAQPHASFTATSVCVGQATHFTSTSTTSPSGQSISGYQWNFGDGQTGTGQTANHTYATAGTYQATLTVSTGNGHCTDQVTQTVTVSAAPNASFTATTVCQGDPTQFTSTASGGQINGYQWNFGDGQTGNGQTVSHSYAQPGTYNVTHTIQTAGGCTDQVTQTVTVNATPVASASATPSTILYGASTTLTADPGTQGTFNFHWEPANMVVNPNAQTTQTVVLQQSQTYTVTITNPQGNCTSTAQVIVSIDGSSLIAMASADQTDLCDGESTTLHAIPSGGAPENYSFQWSPAGSLNSTTSQNPIATPGLGNTTYTCHISDGFTNVNVSVTIHVHPNVEHDIYQTICENDTYPYFGEDIHTPGVYDHTLYTQYGCDSVLHLHLDNWQTYETTISDRFCQNDTYHFYDQDITTPGIYFHTLQSVHDCDSTIRLNLSQDPVYEFEMWESTCEGGDGYLYIDDNVPTYLQPQSQPYIFNYPSVNHCDSTIIIHIEEAEYNSKSYNVSICGTEYTWVSNGVTYYETGVYRDTLHFPGICDSTVVLNLELRPNYYDDVVVSSCDEYRWLDDNFNVDRTFTESTIYTHHYTNVYGCESEATLHLTINDHDEYAFVVPEDEACDEYFWDPNGHEITYTDHAGDLYTMTGVYHRTYLNQAECDSIVTMRVNMEYTPHPTPIYPMDLDNTAPHWVVTATEFQINTYDFNLWDTNPLCRWDTVTWHCVGAPDWVIEPFGAQAKCCKVYVLNHVDDTIWLTAHAFNRCAPDEGITQKYWMVCSFYGVDENVTNSDFSVVPNPNNGQMTLNFENLTGKIKVKVYDMKGALLDDFETYNTMNSYAYTYQMKSRVDGIYFIVATGKEGTIAKKVIIKR